MKILYESAKQQLTITAERSWRYDLATSSWQETPPYSVLKAFAVFLDGVLRPIFPAKATRKRRAPKK